MPLTHIKWDREARAYECACGYLQGERDAVAAHAHDVEYHRIAKEVQGTIGLLPIAGIWPTQLSEEAKPGDIATWNPEDNSVVFHKPIIRGEPWDIVPVASDSKAEEVLDYIHNFDNAGRHISDIDRALGIEPKPKRKWYQFWLRK